MDWFKNYKDNFWTAKSMYYMGLILTIPFIFIAVMGLFDWGFLNEIDSVIGTGFYEARTEVLDWFFIGVTRMADEWFITLLTLAIFLYFIIKLKETRLAIWYVATVALGAWALNQAVKYIIQRPRPTAVEPLIDQDGYSFPSGHAMGSLITYGAIAFIVVRLSKNMIVNWAVVIAMGFLIFFIGISRIYLGVHFASDVIAGYFLGAAWLSFSIGLYGLALTKQEGGNKESPNDRTVNNSNK